jgi:hypothetical protein
MDWKHIGTVTYSRAVYHVWECDRSAEDYTAYQMTRSADVPPAGTGHYTSLIGLMSRFTGPVQLVRD